MFFVLQFKILTLCLDAVLEIPPRNWSPLAEIPSCSMKLWGMGACWALWILGKSDWIELICSCLVTVVESMEDGPIKRVSSQWALCFRWYALELPCPPYKFGDCHEDTNRRIKFRSVLNRTKLHMKCKWHPAHKCSKFRMVDLRKKA